MDKVMKKIEAGREYRDLLLETRDEEGKEEDFTVRGYASTYNEEYPLYSYKYDDDYTVEVREKVDPHAFDKADMSDVIMQYDHTGRVFARKSNRTLSLDEKGPRGLYIEAYLGGTEIGRQLYEEIKGGYTRKMSFGFTVNDDTFEQVESRKDGEVWLRTIKEVGKLYDVSAVSLPANDFTSISARHACEGVLADVEAERTKRAQEEAERLLNEERRKNIESRLKALKGGN